MKSCKILKGEAAKQLSQLLRNVVGLKTERRGCEVARSPGQERNNKPIVLILEDQKDFTNVSFLGPMELIGIGGCPLK